MNSIAIEHRQLGSNQSTFVIAEIGVNHDGSVARALELVDIARQCGADAVKLQIFSGARLMHKSSAFAEYQQHRCVDQSPAEMLRRFELSAGDQSRVVEAIRAAGMVPLATPFSPEDVGAIQTLDLPAIKIASPDMVNRPLLSRCVSTGRPLLISTGASTVAEIASSVEWLCEADAQFALLHCVSSYPTPANQANLCWIGELADAFDVPVGYSDHTTDSLAGALSVAAGACIVEKHLTYDRTASGPDHSASADGEQLAAYIQLIRQAETLRGKPGKRVLDIEQDVRSISRQSLVLSTDLRSGEILCERHLTVQRPGTGIPAAMIAQAVGKRVKESLPAGTLLRWSMLFDAA